MEDLAARFLKRDGAGTAAGADAVSAMESDGVVFQSRTPVNPSINASSTSSSVIEKHQDVPRELLT